MIQLQTQIQQLQDAVARLQQSNDERMGVMKDLVQQNADSINKMSATMETLQKHLQSQTEAQTGKVDQVSGQIQSLNDSLDEMKARLARLEKFMQDVQSQQQSMSANMQGLPQGGAPATATATPAPAVETPAPPPPTPTGRKGKPSAGTPLAAAPAPAPVEAPAATAAPPADDLYKAALGDYMAAKYPLAASEFGDLIKFYPDHPLSGNAFYYQGEIDYRGGQYANAVKSYDKVIEQYPDSSKVPVSHLHKGQALIALKQSRRWRPRTALPHPALPQLTRSHAGPQQTQRHGHPRHPKTPRPIKSSKVSARISHNDSTLRVSPPPMRSRVALFLSDALVAWYSVAPSK